MNSKIMYAFGMHSKRDESVIDDICDIYAELNVPVLMICGKRRRSGIYMVIRAPFWTRGTIVNLAQTIQADIITLDEARSALLHSKTKWIEPSPEDSDNPSEDAVILMDSWSQIFPDKITIEDVSLNSDSPTINPIVLDSDKDNEPDYVLNPKESKEPETYIDKDNDKQEVDNDFIAKFGLKPGEYKVFNYK